MRVRYYGIAGVCVCVCVCVGAGKRGVHEPASFYPPIKHKRRRRLKHRYQLVQYFPPSRQSNTISRAFPTIITNLTPTTANKTPLGVNIPLEKT